MTEVNRREFVTGAAAAAVTFSVLGSIASADDHGPATQPAPGKTDIGAASDYGVDGFNDNWIKSEKFVVIRQNGLVYAASAICTHHGCLLRVETDHLFCKCHKGTFGPDGVPTHRPPIRPLKRFAISIDQNNHLIVDTSTSYDQQHWDDSGASVKTDDAKPSK